MATSPQVARPQTLEERSVQSAPKRLRIQVVQERLLAKLHERLLVSDQEGQTGFDDGEREGGIAAREPSQLHNVDGSACGLLQIGGEPPQVEDMQASWGVDSDVDITERTDGTGRRRTEQDRKIDIRYSVQDWRDSLDDGPRVVALPFLPPFSVAWAAAFGE